MPTHYITSRNLTIPSRDKKAILSAIRFELEDELPFESDDIVFDHSVLTQAKGTTHVHVAITLKSHMTEFLNSVKSTGIDPDQVSTEAWAYRTHFNRVLENDKPVLLVNMGKSRTTIYIHHQGEPVLIRELQWGGHNLTQAISEQYSIPNDQAEQAKLDHGFVIPQSQMEEATADQVAFSQTLYECIQALLWEMRQANLTSKKITKKNTSTIYVSGGTSLLPGLNRVIEENIKIQVKPVRSLTSVSNSGVTYSEHTDASFMLATALGLSMAKIDKATPINLQKGEFAKRGSGSSIQLKNLRGPLTGFGIVTACMLVSLFVQTWVYQSKVKDVDVQLERSVKNFFGQLSPSSARTYLSSPSTLRTAINKDLNKQRELAKLVGPNKHSPLNFLKSISTRVTPSLSVDMINFQVGASSSEDTSGKATLTFLVSDQKIADNLNSILARTLDKMQQDPLTEAKAPTGMKVDGPPKKYWKVTFTGIPTEESYGY
jgi:general secretion pathway protein L